MHPYRTPAGPAPEPAVEPDATRLAFVVLVVVSAVQVATSLPAHGLGSPHTLLGVALLVGGLRWLTTHRRA